MILKKNSLYLWNIIWEDYIDYIDNFLSILSIEEKEKAFERCLIFHQYQFIITRGLLRLLISDFLKQAPSQVKFLYNAAKKPQVVNQKGLEFNISHAGNRVLYGFAINTQIGVDIESITRRLTIDRVARRYFSEQERAQLASLNPLIKKKAFYKGWVQKEAITKAYGLGLQLPLHQIEVNILKGPPCIMQMHNLTLKHLDFLLYFIPVAKNFYGAIAAQTTEKKLRVFCMSSIKHSYFLKMISGS